MSQNKEIMGSDDLIRVSIERKHMNIKISVEGDNCDLLITYPHYGFTLVFSAMHIMC